MAGKKKAAGAPPEEISRAGNRFSKEQLIASARFRERRDILEALLDEGGTYTVKDVEEKVENYMKGRVR